MKIDPNTKVTIGAIVAVAGVIISVMKFLPTPGAEAYVDRQLDRFERRFSRLERQQDLILEKIDRMYERNGQRR